MFAVPGWSVSTEGLKAQTESRHSQAIETRALNETNGTDPRSKKRKRGRSSSKGIEVTGENLAELWRKHILEKHVGLSKNYVEGLGESPIKTSSENQRDVERNGIKSNEGDPGQKNANNVGSRGEEQRKLAKKRKKKNKQREMEEGRDIKYGESSAPPSNDVETVAATMPAERAHPDDDGKSRYERRKAKNARKREQRVQLQAIGALPPARPPPNFNSQSQEISSITKPIRLAVTPNSSNASQEELIKETLNPPQAPNQSVPHAMTATLTPLQQRMAAKLTSARFRHLNQTLYTSPSTEAMRLFTESPQAYVSYHAGFRAQVEAWPQNPVDEFIEDVKSRGGLKISSQKRMWRDMRKGKKLKGHVEDEVTLQGETRRLVDPLPRTHGACIIADLGCGDAHLAALLQSVNKSLNLNILSFDLAKGDTRNAHLITVADSSNLVAAGVKGSSIDVAICCLSLMGTNWMDVVDECARIVRTGGELWIAEIKSRFARPKESKRKGDGIGKQKKGKKGKVEVEENEDDEAIALEELDDAKKLEDRTDVSDFVEVVRKRGFNLKGEPDVTNKMFVKMRFVRMARPDRGAENGKGGKARFGDGFRGKQGKGSFLDEVVDVDESKVLKPCVYKTR
ncbi:25S rRNA (adenine645-N1)-methyltransferase [Puttea exsequens]|nr:25S rRNA (adenine645-N1)-methyltransferase [Puttea exsequens]